jgi:hypothetical protein
MGVMLRRDAVTGNLVASSPGQLVEGPGWMYALAPAYFPQSHAWTFESETPNTVWGAGVYNLADVAPTARAAGASLTAIAEDDDVWGLNVPVIADLAIAIEDLHVGEPLPLPGTAVPISVTVRNLGLGRTKEPVEVKLLLDPGQAEAQTLAAATIPAGLGFMESQTIQATWTAEAGVHILVAHVSPPLEDDSNGLNNYVRVMIGGPPPPRGLVAVPNPHQGVIQLGWQPVEGPAVTDYGVFRAEGEDELAQIGEADDPYFADSSAQPGVTYRYAVCTIALEGVRSMPGEEASAALPELIPVYLPYLSR